MQFLKYTQSLREIISTPGTRKFVLGNSGADYDSVFGSIIYAFFLTKQTHQIYLPLIDCPEKDIPLRFQIDFVMKQYGIQKQCLLYTEMFKDLYSSNNHLFLLYDHNFRKQISANKITEIIDHHTITEQIVCPNVIQKLGSALTLLYYLYNPQSLQKFKEQDLAKKIKKYRQRTKQIENTEKKYDTIIDELFYYGIILDTFNFDSSQKQRWNQYDLNTSNEILEQIQPKISIKQILQSKNSLQRALNLTLQDHLRKDFKEIQYGNHTIKYSVILMNPKLFIQKYWEDVKSVYHPDKMSDNVVYTLMFAYEDQDQNLKRQIIFGGKAQQLINIMQKLLQKKNMKRYDDIGEWKRWQDPSRKMSRKLFDKELKAVI